MTLFTPNFFHSLRKYFAASAYYSFGARHISSPFHRVALFMCPLLFPLWKCFNLNYFKMRNTTVLLAAFLLPQQLFLFLFHFPHGFDIAILPRFGQICGLTVFPLISFFFCCYYLWLLARVTWFFRLFFAVQEFNLRRVSDTSSVFSRFGCVLEWHFF